MLYHETYEGQHEDDLQEAAAEALHDRRYQQQLSRHPQCIDPDHPGCAYCDPETFGEPDDEERDEAEHQRAIAGAARIIKEHQAKMRQGQGGES